MTDGRRETVHGVQALVLSAAVSTLYYQAGSMVVLAAAFASAGVATWHLARAAVPFTTLLWESDTIRPDPFVSRVIGTSMATLGVIGALQFQTNGFPQTASLAIGGTGAAWAVGMLLAEGDDR